MGAVMGADLQHEAPILRRLMDTLPWSAFPESILVEDPVNGLSAESCKY